MYFLLFIFANICFWRELYLSVIARRCSGGRAFGLFSDKYGKSIVNKMLNVLTSILVYRKNKSASSSIFWKRCWKSPCSIRRVLIGLTSHILCIQHLDFLLFFKIIYIKCSWRNEYVMKTVSLCIKLQNLIKYTCLFPN